MLKSLHIKNFASHEDTKLDFHPGFNVIVGEGCSGKTDIIRSLKLLSQFRPVSFRYHSHFAKNKTTSIKTVLDDNTSVKLERTKSTAKYIVENPNGDKQEFRKLNKNVPDVVSKVLNLDSINFQYQFDQPFIVFESPGKITKIINRITKAEVADNWIKKLNEMIKSNNQILSITNEDLKDTKKDIEKLKGLDNVKSLIDSHNKIENEIEKLEDRYETIQNCIRSIKKSKRKIKVINESLLPLEKYYKKIVNIENQISDCKDRKNLIEEYIKSKKYIDQLKEKLKLKNKKFIRLLKKEKKCPLCTSKITDKIIEKIK